MIFQSNRQIRPKLDDALYFILIYPIRVLRIIIRHYQMAKKSILLKEKAIGEKILEGAVKKSYSFMASVESNL